MATGNCEISLRVLAFPSTHLSKISMLSITETAVCCGSLFRLATVTLEKPPVSCNLREPPGRC
jgi:hypothetical protein